MGGAIAAIEHGFFRAEIEREAYAWQRRVESGEEVVVGVNRWQKDDDAEPRIPRVDSEALAEAQRERLARWREARDAARVAAACERLAEAAHGSANLVPLIRGACAAGATVGEVADVLRSEFGTYSDPAGIGG
jgi:methylmalonyl-CoA mutase N-terminal domain/subunit